MTALLLAMVLLMVEHFRVGHALFPLQQLSGSIIGFIIDEDQLLVPVGNASDPTKDLFDQFDLIVDGNNNRQFRFCIQSCSFISNAHGPSWHQGLIVTVKVKDFPKKRKFGLTEQI